MRSSRCTSALLVAGAPLMACAGNPPPPPEASPTLTAQVSGTTRLLQAVSPVDEMIVWVSGHRGTYARTTDGGETWEAAVVPDADTLQFRDVHAVDEHTAYLLGAGPGDMSRIYQTTDRQYFHSDSCDIVGLLCLKTARKGGLSSLVSSVTIYNEMVRRRADLAEVMFQPFDVDRRGETPVGETEYFRIATFHWCGGRLSTRHVRRYIESARRFEAVPPLTDIQVAALDLFDELTNDPALNIDLEFQPGDMQFLHNHQILHDRTAFTDWDDPAKKRHLLRLWLCPPDGRPLPEAFAGNYGSVEIGNRGGIRAPGMVLQAPLEAS